MPNPYFQFKQFTVFHDRCAMKVGTDGVLLGAWVRVNNASRILDVGTGSGLISLMMAQRNPHAQIDAIEIDEAAALQASENFNSSPFRNISESLNQSLQYFAENSLLKYDQIVSNPPFFSRSLKSPDMQRSAARHTDTLPVEDFICLSKRLLTDTGAISFIFPYSEKDYLISLAGDAGLSVSRMTSVRPTPASEPKRVLLELSVEKGDQVSSELVIEESRHIYSGEFTALVKDFYMKM